MGRPQGGHCLQHSQARQRRDRDDRNVFDSLNSFSSFNSNIEINDIPDVLMMSGSMSGAFLELKIRSGDLSYPASIPIANGSALSEALFPDAKLPYMYIGRKWYEDLYHPFHSPSEPVETIEAEVVSEETINVGEDTQRVFRVEYRGEARPGIPEEARLQAVAWVEPKSGDVLRQDVHVGQSKLRFTRVDEDEAREMADRMLASERRGWKSRWMHDRGLRSDSGRSPGPRRAGEQAPRGGHPRPAAPVGPPIPAAH